MGKKPHKRNGRVAKEQRREDANKRHLKIESLFGYRNGARDNKAEGTQVEKRDVPRPRRSVFAKQG